ncbi:MAG: hypothetical protein WB816_11995 [Methylocystis sp.]
MTFLQSAAIWGAACLVAWLFVYGAGKASRGSKAKQDDHADNKITTDDVDAMIAAAIAGNEERRPSTTTTFVFHHDAVDPDQWTAHDIIAFAHVLRGGDPLARAQLAEIGVEIIDSSNMMPLSAALDHIGYVQNGDPQAAPEELHELLSYENESTAVVTPVYFGPPKFAGKFYEADGEDDPPSTNWRLFDTPDQAKRFAADMSAPSEAHGGSAP